MWKSERRHEELAAYGAGGWSLARNWRYEELAERVACGDLEEWVKSFLDFEEEVLGRVLHSKHFRHNVPKRSDEEQRDYVFKYWLIPLFTTLPFMAVDASIEPLAMAFLGDTAEEKAVVGVETVAVMTLLDIVVLSAALLETPQVYFGNSCIALMMLAYKYDRPDIMHFLGEFIATEYSQGIAWDAYPIADDTPYDEDVPHHWFSIDADKQRATLNNVTETAEFRKSVRGKTRIRIRGDRNYLLTPLYIELWLVTASMMQITSQSFDRAKKLRVRVPFEYKIFNVFDGKRGFEKEKGTLKVPDAILDEWHEMESDLPWWYMHHWSILPHNELDVVWVMIEKHGESCQ
jgi:hypothetical protein